MFIAVTRVKGVPKEAIDRMSAAFRQGVKDLESFEGFEGFELWRTEDSLEAVSRWQSKEAMDRYANSPAFGAHHRGGGGGEVAYYDAEVVK